MSYICVAWQTSKVPIDCMLLTCSLSGISDVVYRTLSADASQHIQCSFSSLNHQSVRSAGLFALLRCLIPKQRCRFNKSLELALISEYVNVYLQY